MKFQRSKNQKWNRASLAPFRLGSERTNTSAAVFICQRKILELSVKMNEADGWQESTKEKERKSKTESQVKYLSS